MKARYDPKTMTMVTPEAAKDQKEKEGLDRVSIPGGLASKLLQFADADGIDLIFKTEKGKKVKRSEKGKKVVRTNTLKMFVEIAINHWIEARESLQTD